MSTTLLLNSLSLEARMQLSLPKIEKMLHRSYVAIYGDLLKNI